VERQLNVLISGGFSGAYEQVLPEFERTSGIKVTTGSGASEGTGPQTIAAQLTRGVPANVVILSREGLTGLIAANRIVAGTDVDLARVPLGVAVRAGTPKPNVSTVDAFKQVLLEAKTVAIPGSTGGIWLTNDLFPRLGIAEKISIKARPRGTDATGMVAAGGADLAVMPLGRVNPQRDLNGAWQSTYASEANSDSLPGAVHVATALLTTVQSTGIFSLSRTARHVR
jgi:molybdate transport system substrate-binding protein